MVNAKCIPETIPGNAGQHFIRRTNELLPMDANEENQDQNSMQASTLVYCFNHSPSPITIYDPQLVIRSINPAAARILGKTVDQCLGRSIQEIMPEITESVRSQVDRALAGSTEQFYEQTMRCGDGKYRTFQTMVLRIPGWKNETTLIQFHSTDITQKQSDINHLKETGQMMSQIASSSPVILYLFDLQGGQNRYLNSQFEKILGWNREKNGPIDMQYFEQNLHPDDAVQLPEWAGRWNNASDGEVYSIRYRLRDTSGTYHWFQTYDTVFSRSDDGKVKEILGSAIEFTDLEEARTALEYEQSRLQAIATQAPIAVLECDEAGLIQYLNRPQRRIGLAPEDVLGHSLFEYVDASHHLQLRDSMDRALQGESEVQIELQTNVGGKLQWALVNIARVIYENTECPRRNLLMVGQEISVRKEMEMRLEDLSIQADTANRSKTEFFVGLSHDIRTPMNSILGIADLLLETDLSAGQKEMAQILRDSSEALAGLLERTLQLSRVEMGLMGPLAKRDISLEETLRKSISLFQTQASSKNIELRSSVAPELPLNIKTSESSLMQLLVNLISNAVKYTKSGTVLVEFKASHSLHSNQGKYLCLEVTDTGPGIPAEDLSHVFEMFYRGANAPKDQSSAGIGLSGCKRLVEAAGGTIQVFSPVPEKTTGTMVQVRYPYEEADSRVDDFDFEVWQFQNGLVLLVEDNSLNQYVASRMLENAGLSPVIVADVASAIKELQEQTFDLVLLDLGLPDGDGRTVARWMRSRNIHTPVVAVTAAAFEEEKQSALEAGMNDFLTKPMDQNSLRSVLKKYLLHLRKPDA